MFAKALGAEVYAFTHQKNKEEDIKKMGADHIVLTQVKGFEQKYKMTLDLIISTRDQSDESFPFSEYLS